MKYTVQNTKDLDIKVFDSFDREIRGVTYYNTQTFKLTFYPTYVDSNGKKSFMSELDENGKGKAKKVTTTWRGSYAVVDGVRVK